MSRKIYSIISLVVIFLSQILIVAYCVNSNNISTTSESQPQNTTPDLPEETPELIIPEETPELVIPESHLGTLGLISALAAAFGTFALIHKRK